MNKEEITVYVEGEERLFPISASVGSEALI